MEKVSFQNNIGLYLVGYYDEPDDQSDSIVMFVHGLADDKSERGRFDVLSMILKDNDYNTMRFDLAGHGESDNYQISLRQGAKDVGSAIKHILDRGYSRLTLIGYCSGGTLCMKNVVPEVESLYLISPLTDKKLDFLGRFNSEQMLELRDKGFLEYSMQSAWRDKIVISEELLEEMRSINQEELAASVKVPTRIIHGAQDEQIPTDVSYRASELINAETKFNIVEGMGHSFYYHLNNIAEDILDWLGGYEKS